MTQINVRITESEKMEALTLAEELGISLSELVRTRLKNVPVTNQKNQLLMIQAIVALTGEFNKIGQNINQICKAFNQINLDYNLPGEEVLQFSKMMDQYLKKRSELGFILENLMP